MNNEQGSDGWHQERLGIPTASRYGEVIAKPRSGYGEATSRANYKAECLVERFTHEPYQRFNTTADMDWGNLMEPAARTNYTLETGNYAEESPFKRHELLPTGGSPDGIVLIDSWMGKGKGGIEIKSRNPAHHHEALKTKKIPRQYKAQVQGNLMNHPDCEWWDWISYEPHFPANARIIVIRAYRDEGYIDMLQNEIAIFCDELDDMEKDVREYKNDWQKTN